MQRFQLIASSTVRLLGSKALRVKQFKTSWWATISTKTWDCGRLKAAVSSKIVTNWIYYGLLFKISLVKQRHLTWQSLAPRTPLSGQNATSSFLKTARLSIMSKWPTILTKSIHSWLHWAIRRASVKRSTTLKKLLRRRMLYSAKGRPLTRWKDGALTLRTS